MKKKLTKSIARKKGELVLEIGTEEIPSGVIRLALEGIKSKTLAMFAEARIPAERVEAYATPRRFVILASGIREHQQSEVLEVMGPPRTAAYDKEGRPKPAAIGFAKSLGVSVQSLEIKLTAKGEYLYANQKQPSLSARKVLVKLIPELISGMTFPKTMRWNDQGLKFSRPIRWVVAVLDGVTLSFRLGSLKSGNRSYGHRFMANRSFIVKNTAGYRRELKRLHVVLDPAEREEIIRKGLARLIAQKKGQMDRMDRELLEQAVFLTEKPVVFAGQFEARYLKLPDAVLVTVMKDHQGYFPVRDKNGSLLPFFLFVSNIQSPKPDLIRRGNERVLRARLEDARFYFEQDKQLSLKKYEQLLKGLVFHENLGSMQEKIERLREFSGVMMGWAGRSKEEIRRVQEAAFQCKSDLLSGMVREFPALEGIMGRVYALEQGEESEVADAIAEHYFPRMAEDPQAPRTLTGKFLTVADRLDNLIGFFGLGLNPTGSMDPYALRRQGLGLIQVLIGEAFSGLSLDQMMSHGIKLYTDGGFSFKKDPLTVKRELQVFMAQRMETYLERRFESDSTYRADLAAVILARTIDSPLDHFLRYVSLVAFSQTRDFEPLILTFKRASRIVPKEFAGEVDKDGLGEAVEKELYEAFLKVKADFEKFLLEQNYTDLLQSLTHLRMPIDRFFDEVMVMDPDQEKKKNRLALLSGIKELFIRFGDFTQVAVDEQIKAKTTGESRQTALVGNVE